MSSSRKFAPVFWFTGLSGAGKSTIADMVAAALKAGGLTVAVFDGDDVRRNRAVPLGFSRAHVLINNGEIAALCHGARNKVDVILVPIIAPYAEGRAAARAAIGDGFYEIYFNADADCVAARDAKGLYAKAATGDIPPMIGFAPEVPFEAPENPDLVIDTAAQGATQSAEKLSRFVRLNVS